MVTEQKAEAEEKAEPRRKHLTIFKVVSFKCLRLYVINLVYLFEPIYEPVSKQIHLESARKVVWLSNSDHPGG